MPEPEILLKAKPRPEAGGQEQSEARPESGDGPGPPPPRRLGPVKLGLALSLALALLAFLSLGGGDMPFSLEEIWRIVWSGLGGEDSGYGENRVMVIWQIRLPRIAVAILAGAALGLSGAIFQGILLNPLADPYTLGVSSGAAFGAALVIIASLIFPEAAFVLATPMAPAVGAFISSALTLVLVTALASDKEGHLPPSNLILAGVIVSASLSAAISFMKYLAGDQVSSIVFRLLGSFQSLSWAEAGLVLAFFLPAFGLSMASAMDLNIMTLGLRSAETLGVSTGKVRLRLLAATSMAASATVAVAGIIGFVGLIVPHLMRMLTGPDHRSLLPLSALGGALLMVAADTTVRVFLPGEIPVGVLTAILAGPAFLIIFRRKMKDLFQA